MVKITTKARTRAIVPFCCKWREIRNIEPFGFEKLVEMLLIDRSQVVAIVSCWKFVCMLVHLGVRFPINIDQIQATV